MMERTAEFLVGTECTTVSYLEVDYESCSIYEIKFVNTCVRMKYRPVFKFLFLILFLSLI